MIFLDGLCPAMRCPEVVPNLMRVHPVTGVYKLHTGIDIPATGTNTRSGIRASDHRKLPRGLMVIASLLITAMATLPFMAISLPSQ